MKEQIKLLIEYQEFDKELKKIEDGILKTDEADKYYKSRKFLSNVSDNLNEIDKRAQGLLAKYESITKELKQLNDIACEHMKALDECEENEVSYIVKKYKERMGELNAKETELNALVKEMEALNKEFTKLASDRKKMKEQFDTYKPKFEELRNSKLNEVKALKQKQAESEKNIAPEILDKYNAKRKDKKFPVVFGVTIDKKGAYCPACGSSLSVVSINNLTDGNLGECDTCRSIIYALEK